MSFVFSFRTLACALLLLSAAVSAPAMAQGIVMTVQSQQAGQFPAETSAGSKSQPNTIPLRAWTYAAEIPVSQAGAATGPRRYGPVSFDKALGAASPYLLKAMLTGDQLAITVDVMGVSPTGAPLLIHRVTFTQARILSIVRKATAPTTGERVIVVEAIETVTFDFRSVDFDPGRPGGSLHDELEQ